MKAKTPEQIHYNAVKLGALLNTLHAALPDDALGCEIDTRFIVGWAYEMANELSNDIDLLGLHHQGDGDGESGKTKALSPTGR